MRLRELVMKNLVLLSTILMAMSHQSWGSHPIDVCKIGGVQISLESVQIKQHGEKEMVGLSGEELILQPGLLLVDCEVRLENLSDVPIEIPLSDVCMTDIPDLEKISTYASPGSGYEFYPATFGDLESPAGAATAAVHLAARESDVISLNVVADPDRERYRLLFPHGEEMALVDCMKKPPGRDCFNIRISDVLKSPKGLRVKDGSGRLLDGLVIDFIVLNETQVTWVMDYQECFRAFQEDGRFMYQFPKTEDTSCTVGPGDSISVSLMWMGKFEGQQTPVLYVVPPIDLALDIDTGEKVDPIPPRRVVQSDRHEWQND